jgi:hypothetical protein
VVTAVLTLRVSGREAKPSAMRLAWGTTKVPDLAASSAENWLCACVDPPYS